jgi:hypothetical protein
MCRPHARYAGISLWLRQNPLEGNGRKAKVNLGRGIAPQPRHLEAELSDSLLEALVLTIEEAHHFPQLLRITHLVDLEHAGILSPTTHRRKLSIRIDGRWRQRPPTDLPAALKEQGKLGRR